MLINRRRRSFARRICVLLAILVFNVGASGCGEAVPEPVVKISRKPVKVVDLPEPILKAAKKALRGVKFQEAWSNHDQAGETTAFELRGMTAEGKIRDVRLTVSGTVLETE